MGCFVCKVFKFFCAIITFIVLALAITGLVFWNKHRKLEFYVNDAAVSQFNYTNQTLNYNMTLNITLHNPNYKHSFSFSYNAINGSAFYQDQRFSNPNASIWKPSLVLKRRKWFYTRIMFDGQQVLNFSDNQISVLKKEKDSLAYNIVMRFTLFSPNNKSTNVFCGLKVPIAAKNGSTIRFNPIQCKLVK